MSARRTALSIGALVATTAMASGACSSRTDIDPPAPYTPSPDGSGLHIADISNPNGAKHAALNSTVTVTGVVVTEVDTFDETSDGKSAGTIYVQDLESNAPFAAINLYKPTFVPSSLVVGPGDTVDLTGEYQEESTIGTTVTFPAGEVLPQLYEPGGTFRFEYKAPDPTPINITDLAAYATGRQWLSQVVTISNVTLATAMTSSGGRQSAQILPTSTAPGADEAPTMTNELVALPAYPAGQQFKSITGVITYFYNLHIAPRSLDDIVTQ